ncbi:hypothetical protein LEP1GSC018_0167 [Leptospira kirschneri str. 2008720114]|nr:hypothetical protein LEP1GSC018_0167 [Leptospira kirschneri str. 2008720114]
MYVDIPWHPEVTCVYYDLETSKLVKVDVPPEDLGRKRNYFSNVCEVVF